MNLYINNTHIEGNIDYYEDKIINYIKNNNIEDSNKIIEEDNLAEIFHVFSELNNNILSWYDFKEDSKVLLVNSLSVNIIQLLNKKVKKLCVIEDVLEKAKAIEKWCNNLENLEVYVDSVENYSQTQKQNKLLEKFDYIIIFDNANNISYLKNVLKDDGSILFITDNRFGTAYMSGEKKRNQTIYETLYSSKNLFSKIELEKFLEKQGFYNYKFYYPLPNYRITNVIFSDDYLPKNNDSKLIYNNYYQTGSVIVCDELKLIRELNKNDLFTFFVNSFFVEISKSNLSNINFVSYNNNRKPEYRLVTKIYQDEVIKENTNNESQKHIENIRTNIEQLENMGFNIIDEYRDGKIYSKYQSMKKFDEIIIEKIENNELDLAIELIEKWFNEIKHKYQSNESSKIFKDRIYIDLVFENTFYNNDEFYFFDQEWYLENVELEFILYRAINNIYIYNLSLEKYITLESLLKRFNIFEKYEKFKNIEQEFQNKIISDEMLNINRRSYEKMIDINHFSILNTQIIDFKNEDIRKEKYIKELENENQRKSKYIEELENENLKKENYIKFLEDECEKNKKRNK